MRRIQKQFFPVTLVSVACGMTAPPSQTPPVPSQPSALLSEAVGLNGLVMFISSGAPGMVLVVVRGEDTVIQGYGETSEGNGSVPNETSLLRLGSVTKVFTAEVLAALVNSGKVRLTDPLSQYAQGAPVPNFGERQITLLDLATHSAGLPRDAGEFPANRAPFTWPTRAELWDWLSQNPLHWAPGDVASYSNAGFSLLADALAVAGGKPYPQLLREFVSDPLGMPDTTLDPSQDQCDRLMTGSGFGGPGPCVNTEATQGNGGLYSTGADMARWLRHNLDGANPAAWPVLTLAHAVYRQRQSMTAAIGFDESGPMSGIGLGWITMSADGHLPMIVQKAGGGGGFMTYIAFAPGRDVGIFWAVNRVDFTMGSALGVAANELLANLVTR
jgi:serine-type D-Ala-D-Ala carboxypeptidase/endopeptidase